jgi:predicted DNA-binding helix-hairpin-helix protein
VVGGTDENDVELLQISEFLYSHLHLSRTYYSAFSPIPGTPLENRQAEDDWRRYRLFQASFLLRDYPFQMEDMVFDHQGRLPLDRDPKQAWAEVFLKEQPVEVNTASREELLHIPGIGLKGANQIIVTRYKNPFKSEGDLNRVGVILGRAAPYLLVNGSRLPFQPALIGS